MKLPGRPPGLCGTGGLLRDFTASSFSILPVLPEKDMAVLPTGDIRRGNVVINGFQPLKDFVSGLFVRLSAFGVKLGHYLGQAVDSDLGPIRKP